MLSIFSRNTTHPRRTTNWCMCLTNPTIITTLNCLHFTWHGKRSIDRPGTSLPSTCEWWQITDWAGSPSPLLIQSPTSPTCSLRQWGNLELHFAEIELQILNGIVIGKVRRALWYAACNVRLMVDPANWRLDSDFYSVHTNVQYICFHSYQSCRNSSSRGDTPWTARCSRVLITTLIPLAAITWMRCWTLVCVWTWKGFLRSATGVIYENECSSILMHLCHI